MADIYKFIKKSSNSRPLYTSYELSKLVKDMRIREDIDEAEFASRHGISIELLQRIEEGNSTFSPKLYRVCGKILGLSTEELLSEITDDVDAANFRLNVNDDNVQETFNLANMLFNEIIMQEKIGIN